MNTHLFEAIEHVQRASGRTMRAFDATVQSISDHEDEEWMRLARKELGIPKIQPNVFVKEIDHSSIVHNDPNWPPVSAQAKADAYRKASGVRSRVGNSVPTSKSKAKNRQKAKAARKAKKR